MRDIPANYIVAGTTKSNLRQIVQRRMAERGVTCACIRCREVRSKTMLGNCRFVTRHRNVRDRRHSRGIYPVPHHNRQSGCVPAPIAAQQATRYDPAPEIREAAMVRELHVYGPAQELGTRREGVQASRPGHAVARGRCGKSPGRRLPGTGGHCCSRDAGVLPGARFRRGKPLSYSGSGYNSPGIDRPSCSRRSFLSRAQCSSSLPCCTS